MIWQDAVLLVGQVVLGLTLLPTLRAGAPVPRLTSVPAAAVLFGFAVTFLSLGLYGATITSSFNAGTWLLIARWCRA
mgnify:FL=1